MLPIFAIKPPTPVQAAALIRRPNLGRQADFPKVGEFAPDFSIQQGRNAAFPIGEWGVGTEETTSSAGGAGALRRALA